MGEDLPRPVMQANAPPSPPSRVRAEAKTSSGCGPAQARAATVEHLKESKRGLVAWMQVTGREKDEIAKAVKDTSRVSEAQAVKMVRGTRTATPTRPLNAINSGRNMNLRGSDS